MVEIELKSFASSSNSGYNQTEKEVTKTEKSTKKSSKSASNQSSSQHQSCSISSSSKQESSESSGNEFHNPDGLQSHSASVQEEVECVDRTTIEEIYPKAKIVDKYKIFKKLNLPLHSTGSFLVCWPDEEWRRNGGQNAWSSTSLPIENGLEGCVVYVWTPFHPNQTLRSHAGFICLLKVHQEISGQKTLIYIPILKEGIEILDTDSFHNMFSTLQ
uniref:Uncharacterized protein n=1 Tax=Ditylenchus dipsaci TaxID=166011 RepID=A0A915DST7_9BILA